MSLIYPENGVRSFTHNRDLSRFVDAHLSKVVGETAIFESVLLKHLMGKKKTFTGDRLAWAAYKTDGTAGASIFFNIGNATSDAVTAAERDNAYIRLETDPKNAGRKIMLSKIKMRQAGGKEARIEYVKTQLKAVALELGQGTGRALYTGNPSATNAAEFTGLDNTIAYTGSYGGTTRITSRSLVGNKLSATATSNAIQTASSVQAANGSATLTKNGHGLTVSAGDICEITDDSGNVRWYYITAYDTNTITIAPAYEGATDTTVSIRVYSPFVDTNKFGGSGDLTLAKVNKARTMAIDGQHAPDLGIAHSFVWSELRQLVLDTEHSISRADLSRLGSSGVENFTVLDMPMVVDNNAPLTKLYMANTNFLDFKLLKGYDKPVLGEDGLITQAAADGKFASMIGEVVIVGDLISEGCNRHAVLTDIAIA